MDVIVREIYVCGGCGARVSPKDNICSYCGNFLVPLQEIPTTEIKYWKPDTLKCVAQEKLIEDLLDGESGYTMFWALSMDVTTIIGINKSYPAMPKKFGTANVLVTRQSGIIIVEFTESTEIHRTSWPRNRTIPAVLSSNSKQIFIEPIVSELLEGESGYTVPWALNSYKDRPISIDGSFNVSSSSGGTVQLYIVKKGGFIEATPLVTDSRWSVWSGRKIKVPIAYK